MKRIFLLTLISLPYKLWFVGTDLTHRLHDNLADRQYHPCGQRSTGIKGHSIASLPGPVKRATTSSSSPTTARPGRSFGVTDGTTANTRRVKDIYSGTSSSGIKWITRFNDKVVFQARQDDATGYELWISDGTSAGTVMLKDIHPGRSSRPFGFVQINETQFVFAAKDCESSSEGTLGQSWLWISDGTTAGTHLLKDCSYIPYGLPNNAYGQNANPHRPSGLFPGARPQGGVRNGIVGHGRHHGWHPDGQGHLQWNRPGGKD